MAEIQFSTNAVWQNWQGSISDAKAEEKMHAGWKAYPPAFVSHYAKADDLQAYFDVISKLKADGVESLVIMGIGGSSLGSIALQHFFDRYSKKLYFWEGPHPQTMRHIGKMAETKKTAVLWISKSGSTLETRTSLALFRQFFPGVPEYFVTSEPKKIADLKPKPENIFHIPEPLGGRFSIVSPVGILPAMFLGFDIVSFLSGFEEGVEAWDISNPVSGNTAKKTAMQYKEILTAGFSGVVFWVYSQELQGWGKWLVQLWGESLGKKPEVAAFPIMAAGPEDQHSLLQYFMEGPNTFIHNFVHVNSYGSHDTVVPDSVKTEAVNHSLFEVLNAQMRSIELALDEVKRPVSEYILPDLSASILGRWMCFWMYVVSYVGYLYEVNPFDQPGVEAGKIYCKKLLTGQNTREVMIHNQNL